MLKITGVEYRRINNAGYVMACNFIDEQGTQKLISLHVDAPIKVGMSVSLNDLYAYYTKVPEPCLIIDGKVHCSLGKISGLEVLCNRILLESNGLEVSIFSIDAGSISVGEELVAFTDLGHRRIKGVNGGLLEDLIRILNDRGFKPDSIRIRPSRISCVVSELRLSFSN